MSRLVIAEMGHVVSILGPVDITGGATIDIFSMRRHSHASIIIQFAATAAAATLITVEECTDAAGTGNTEIDHSIYKEETDGGDTLGARTAVVAATGTTPSANDNIFYVIELDAAELSPGSEWVKLTITAPASAILCSAVAILSGARYASPQSATEIA